MSYGAGASGSCCLNSDLNGSITTLWGGEQGIQCSGSLQLNQSFRMRGTQSDTPRAMSA